MSGDGCLVLIGKSRRYHSQIGVCSEITVLLQPHVREGVKHGHHGHAFVSSISHEVAQHPLKVPALDRGIVKHHQSVLPRRAPWLADVGIRRGFQSTVAGRGIAVVLVFVKVKFQRRHFSGHHAFDKFGFSRMTAAHYGHGEWKVTYEVAPLVSGVAVDESFVHRDLQHVGRICHLRLTILTL